MTSVGIRALKQNASAVVAEAAAGEIITITDRGRPVAQLCPLVRLRLDAMVQAGRARRPRRQLRDLPPAVAGPALSPTLSELRESERW